MSLGKEIEDSEFRNKQVWERYERERNELLGYMDLKQNKPKAYELSITEKYVNLCIGNKNWSFLIEKFSEEEIKSIKEGHRCGGCMDMPTKGFKSKKYSWCSLSRKIATLQE